MILAAMRAVSIIAAYQNASKKRLRADVSVTIGSGTEALRIGARKTRCARYSRGRIVNGRIRPCRKTFRNQE
jgi:hypothetical protein